MLYPPADSLHSLHDCFPLLQSSTFACTIRWSVPPLQSCVFIKHHNYFATRPEVGAIFSPWHVSVELFTVLWQNLPGWAPFQFFSVVLPRLELAPFFIFLSVIYFTISVHQRAHITLLCSLPPQVTLPSILPFNLINMC